MYLDFYELYKLTFLCRYFHFSLRCALLFPFPYLMHPSSRRNESEKGSVELKKRMVNGEEPGVTFPSIPAVLPCVGISRKE